MMRRFDHQLVAIEPDRIAGMLGSLVSPYEPGVAIGISHRGGAIFEGAVGLACIELRTPLSIRTGLAIGSCTKHLTCLAFLLLCEQGLASVDDKIGTYLPDLPRFAREVTVRQLMGHLSGLRDAAEISMLFDGFSRPIPLQAILQLYRDIGSVDGAPGHVWSYNNGGYMLLSAILERAYDAPLEQILERKIFKPADLGDTYLERFDRGKRAGRARQYRKSGKDFIETRRSIEGLGQGGVISSVRDLIGWLGQFQAPVVGTPDSWTFLASPMRLSGNVCTGYAAGLRIGHYRGLPILHHPGSVPGGNAQMLKAPTLGLDLVVLTNRQDLSAIDIASKFLDMLVIGLDPKPSTAPAMLVGAYRSVKSGRLVELKKSGESQRLVIDGAELPTVRDDAGALRPMAGGLLRPEKIYLDPTEPNHLLFERFGERQKLSRVPPSHRGRNRKRTKFGVPGTGLSLALESEAALVRASGAIGHADYDVVPVARNIWAGHARSAFPMTAILALEADGSLSLSNPRVRGLRLAPFELAS